MFQYSTVMGFLSNRRTWLACLFLVFATVCAYWPVRHYDFVEYDDGGYVFDNPVVRAGLSWQGFAWAFAGEHDCNWHPLTWLSHMADCQLFGLNPGAMHLENVLLHCANSVLLLLLLNSLTGKLGRSAFVVALFALHPLRVESVAWIAERKDVLSGFFFMLTLWFYALHAKKQTVIADSKFQKNNFYRLSWLCFTLGLLAKPMLVTVPIILLLLDFWPLKRFTIYDLRFTIARLVREKIPFFLLSIIAGIITLFTQRAGGGWVPSDSHFFPRMANVVIGYWGYIEKLLWPQNLSFLYLRSNRISLAEFFLATSVLTGVSILAAVQLRRRPWLAVGWLWFLVMLLPVSGLLQIGYLSIADRYTYLPAIGFYLMAVWGTMDLLAVLFPQKICRWLATAGATAILLACVILTRQQLVCWRNTQTLMEHALKIDPNNYVAQVDLRIYLFEKEHPGVREHRRNPTGVNSEK
jgi:protein O-mannosyl-transferase